MTDSAGTLSHIGSARARRIEPGRPSRRPGGERVNHRSFGIVGVALLAALPRPDAQSEPAARPAAAAAHGPYARIAIMRALDGHALEWEEGYIRHLEWHRQVKD